MPGRLKVRVLAARDLPVMDRASDSSDAFAEVRFDGEMFKTEVCKKSLNPQWNSEWFKFEVDDEVLQDEPLDIRVLDYDTYSAHDAIGKVYIDLSPLLTNSLPYVISGWFPIYDTMHGIRGELNVQVKVELFNDVNKFRQSSCGIQFFCTAAVPSGYILQGVQGFVEELVVNDDPEYQFIDKIRTSRASNEARQRLFSKLSGILQRQVGVKVLEMGGNAVLGYTQNFDLEGESGIVVRAIGTAVQISKIRLGQSSPMGISPSTHMHDTALNSSSHSRPHHHHNNSLHHHHNNHPPPVFQKRQRRRHSSHHHHHHHHHGSGHHHHGYHHHDSTASGLAISPPSTPTKAPPGGGGLGYIHPSPPPSAPPLFSGSPEFVFGSYDDSRGHFGGEYVGQGQSPQVQGHDGVNELVGRGGGGGGGGGGSQVHGHEADNEFEDGDLHGFLPSSSPHTEDAGGVSGGGGGGGGVPPPPPAVSPSLAAGQRHSVSPIRTTGAVNINAGGNRRLSDSDVGSPGNSLGDSGSAFNLSTSTTRHTPPRGNVNQQNISLLEYPFFTMRSFPPGFIVSLGSMVSARSVKLLDKIHNPEEPETRDMWWSEIRTEIRSHARSMNCHAVLGYIEQTTICDETIILSASGTAARIRCDFNQGASPQPAQPPGPVAPSLEHQISLDRDTRGEQRRLTVDIGLASQLAQMKLNAAFNPEGAEEVSENCSVCHIPYGLSSLPFPVNLSSCALCKKKKVPDVLFTTIDPPKEVPILSHGALIQARVCRAKGKGKGSETSAREVSDSLPFLEFEVHSQLLYKLKLRGLNGLFGLKIQICLGENMIAALATGTGVFLSPMPQPPLPKLCTQVQGATQEENRNLADLQARISDITHQHRQRLNTEIAAAEDGPSVADLTPFNTATTDDSDEDQSDAEAFFSNKETFVLEIDDPKDEILSLVLHDSNPPEGFHVCNTQFPPGISPAKLVSHAQMFTQMAQIRYAPNINSKLEFADIFDMLLRRICFKMRRLTPCCLTDINFHMEIPDEDEVQISVTGCCLSLGEAPLQNTGLLTLPPTTTSSARQSPRPPGPGQEDMMFNLEVDADPAKTQPAVVKQSKTDDKRKGQSKIPKRRSGVELTPLPTVVGGTIVKYLGNFNFFLIRESTSIKECGGLGGFMQSFVGEVMAIVRGHVSALGGNALVGYQMSHCVLFSSPHKNQAQCLYNVCGDAVQVHYDNEPASTEPFNVADFS